MEDPRDTQATLSQGFMLGIYMAIIALVVHLVCT